MPRQAGASRLIATLEGGGNEAHMRTLSKISFMPKLTLVFSTALREIHLGFLRAPSVKVSSGRPCVGARRSSPPSGRLQFSGLLGTRSVPSDSMHHHVTAIAPCSSVSARGFGSFASPARLPSTGSQGCQSVLRPRRAVAIVPEPQYGLYAKRGGISPLARVAFLWQCRGIATHVKVAV